MWPSCRVDALHATMLLVLPMSYRTLRSWNVRLLRLSSVVRHGYLPMSARRHTRGPPRRGHLGTLGMVMAWYHSRRVVLGVVSWSDPLLSLASGSVVALVHNCSFSRIVVLVVVFAVSRFLQLLVLVCLMARRCG